MSDRIPAAISEVLAKTLNADALRDAAITGWAEATSREQGAFLDALARALDKCCAYDPTLRGRQIMWLEHEMGDDGRALLRDIVAWMQAK